MNNFGTSFDSGNMSRIPENQHHPPSNQPLEPQQVLEQHQQQHQQQQQQQHQRQPQGQPNTEAVQQLSNTSSSVAHPMTQSSSFTFENFHLDPQDFQNFLLINPPLTEYSSHYYMNLSNSNNSTNSNPNKTIQSNSNNNNNNNNNNNMLATSQVSRNTINQEIIADVSPTSSNEYSNQLINYKKTMSPIPDTLANTHISDDLNNYYPNEGPAPNPNPMNGDITFLNADSQTHLGPPPPSQQQHFPPPQQSQSNHPLHQNNPHRHHSQQPQHFHHPVSQQQQQQQQQQQPVPQQHQSQQQHHYNHQNNNNHNSNSYAFDFDVKFDDQQLPLPSRRLSISNGQIGQISMMVHSQLHPQSTTSDSSTNNDVLLQQQQQQQQTPVIPEQTTLQTGSSQQQTTTTSTVIGGVDSIEVDNNGVPTRQLIYNNEVIFNPNGPIPGTNAWKRAKILERNRIAASKCRAKKKNLQKKLQQDVDDLNEENSRLRDMLNEMKNRADRYCQLNNLTLADIFSNDGMDIKKEENFNDDDKIKRLRAQHTKAHVDVFIKDGFL